MSPAPLTPDQYELIGTALAQVSPPGWTAIELTVVCAGPETRSRLGVRMPDGRVVKAGRPVPREVTRLLRELRQHAYRPEVGTWFTAHVTVEAAGRIGIDFDYDSPPPLEPAPNSWAAELSRFPRSPEHTPAWLQQYASTSTDWLGARWQIELRPPGAPAKPVAEIDASTTAEAHAWAVAVAERLGTDGIAARLSTDTGEDGRGAATSYDELLVSVGEGHMALAFWRELIAWTVDVLPDQVDRGTFSHIVTRTLAAVREVTGYSPDLAGLGTYELALIDLGPAV